MAVSLLAIHYPDYLSFLVDRSPWDVLNLFLLCLARVVPIIALAPFLGGKMLSDTMKIGFGVAIVPLFLPFLLMQKTAHLEYDVFFLLLVVKEVMVGSFLGFLAAIPFYICQGAGALVDHQRGSQSLQVTDPSTQVQSSPLGMLYNNMLLVIFFQIGGPLIFFNSLFTSYEVIPPDKFFSEAFFNKDLPLWHTTFSLVGVLIKLTVQLSAPPVMAMLMSDLFLGIANRMAPQVQISFLLWSLKAYVGIAIIWAGWWYVIKELENEGNAWTKMIETLLQGLKGLS